MERPKLPSNTALKAILILAIFGAIAAVSWLVKVIF